MAIQGKGILGDVKGKVGSVVGRKTKQGNILQRKTDSELLAESAKNSDYAYRFKMVQKFYWGLTLGSRNIMWTVKTDGLEKNNVAMRKLIKHIDAFGAPNVGGSDFMDGNIRNMQQFTFVGQPTSTTIRFNRVLWPSSLYPSGTISLRYVMLDVTTNTFLVAAGISPYASGLLTVTNNRFVVGRTYRIWYWLTIANGKYISSPYMFTFVKT